MVALSPIWSYRRLLVTPELRAEPATGNRTSDDFFYGGNGDVEGFDCNMVIVLAALLCALICVIGINSIIRCAIRCGYMCAIFEASAPNNNDNHNHEHALVTTGLELANTGLKKSTLSQIPVVAYGSSAGLNIPAATDCPICLGEFEEGEKVRILPECKHGFHVQCIDTWFVSHTSCPLCRQLPYIDHQREEEGNFRSVRFPENGAS